VALENALTIYVAAVNSTAVKILQKKSPRRKNLNKKQVTDIIDFDLKK
jgi:hypothetical protein